MEVIMYVMPNPDSIISGQSYSISQYETPPSSSPTPDSRRDVKSGETALQVEQYEAVQNVKRGRREEVERER